MARYSKEFKQMVVARLLPPESCPLERLSKELGINLATLERWRAEALALPQAARDWNGAGRLEALIVTAAMDESAKSAWCREKGLYPRELESWRSTAIEALAKPGEARATPQQTREDKQRIRKLEREINRKDKALAETAALLVLSKKLTEVFGEGADA